MKQRKRHELRQSIKTQFTQDPLNGKRDPKTVDVILKALKILKYPGADREDPGEIALRFQAGHEVQDRWGIRQPLIREDDHCPLYSVAITAAAGAHFSIHQQLCSSQSMNLEWPS